MKLDSHLPKLPSVSELLADPRVKRLVGLVHQSTLAQRAGSFLEELRAAIAERARNAGWTEGRPGVSEWPSLGQLAERFARRVLGPPPEGVAVVNATGVVIGNARYAPPLAEGAVHALLAQASDFALAERQMQIATCELARLVAGEEGLAASNYESALLLVMASVGAGGAVLIIERPSGEPSGAHSATDAHGACTNRRPTAWTSGELGVERRAIDWQALGRYAGVTVRFANDSDVLTRNAPQDAKLWIVRSTPACEIRGERADGERWDGHQELAQLSSLCRQASLHNARVVQAVPWAGVVDPGDHGFQSIPTLAQRLSAGASAVVVAGDGLLGGPPLGVVVGEGRLVGHARAHPLWPIVGAGPFEVSSLSATLAMYADPARALHQLPVWQLLTAPLDNLRNRCERLAPLLAQLPEAASAAPCEVESAWLRWGEGPVAYGPSWAIAIEPQSGDPESLAQRLSRQPIAIHGRVAETKLLLDLRSVFPRWDHQLELLWTRATAPAEGEGEVDEGVVQS